MKIKELIDKLQWFDDESEVLARIVNGYVEFTFIDPVIEDEYNTLSIKIKIKET